MKLGIVGHEAAKFTKKGEKEAKDYITRLLTYTWPVEAVVSGGCHLGGIDIWAEEIAKARHIPTEICYPEKLQWLGGYKERNQKIAELSDAVVCIVVVRLADSYTGMKFDGCYHCGMKEKNHIKSGGCWTMKLAKAQGKFTRLVLIANEE